MSNRDADDDARKSRIREANRKRLDSLVCGKRPTSLEMFMLTRSYIEHEDGLINIRTTWFITINSFLFTALAISSASDSIGRNANFLGLAFSAIGITISITTYYSVGAAYSSIKKLKRHWCSVHEPVDDDLEDIALFPHVVGGGPNLRIAYRGRISSKWMPYATGFTWSAILAVCCVNLLSNTALLWQELSKYGLFIVLTWVLIFFIAQSLKPRNLSKPPPQVSKVVDQISSEAAQ